MIRNPSPVKFFVQRLLLETPINTTAEAVDILKRIDVLDKRAWNLILKVIDFHPKRDYCDRLKFALKMFDLEKEKTEYATSS